MNIFNINQTILASVFASKEQRENIRSPEEMHRFAVQTMQEHIRREMHEVQQADKVLPADADAQKKEQAFRKHLAKKSANPEDQNVEQDPTATDEHLPPSPNPHIGSHIDFQL